MTIVVSGGAVPAKLDAVKTITNKFKGGRMAELADKLSARSDEKVIYLCTKDSVHPQYAEVVYFEDFHEYKKRVELLAKQASMMVLGAAVANLIPDERWQEITLKGGKFPSHDYEEGDPVQVLFRIAPRVINTVHDINPRANLVAFKLLSGVSRDDLVEAARLTQRESKAKLVIANDAEDLDTKYAVTPEGGWYQMEDIVTDLVPFLTDVYYSTVISDCSVEDRGEDLTKAEGQFYNLVAHNSEELQLGEQENGMIFGCVAVRIGNTESFLISTRGKKEVGAFTRVKRIGVRLVVIEKGHPKASLNAPLINQLFQQDPQKQAVVHYHTHLHDDDSLPYAPPGTVRDTMRNFNTLEDSYDFYIEGHGVFESLTKEQLDYEF